MFDWDTDPSNRVHGETWFIVHLIGAVLLVVPRACLALLGYIHRDDVLKPFRSAFTVLFEAKSVLWIGGALLVAFICQGFMPQSAVSALIMRSSDLVSGRIHTVLTASFLHAGISHLLGNIAALFIFGRVVERYFGAATVYTTYFVGVIVGGIATQLIHYVQGGSWGAIGASIGVSSLIAVAVLRAPLYLTYVFIIPLPIAFLGAAYIWQESVNLFADDGVSHLGHIAGVVVGFGLTALTGGLMRAWKRVLLGGVVAAATVAALALL